MMRFMRFFRQTLVLSMICLVIPGLFTRPVYAQVDNPPPQDGLEPVTRFAHLTSDDGLADNTVEAILQDHTGFMWFGTNDGLSRYDGYKFTTYRHDPQQSNSLSQNHIHDLFEDKDGNIWIGTEGGGVNRFDPRTETFTSYMPDRNNPNSIAGDRVFHIFQDSRNNMWFVGGGLTGVNIFNPATQFFTQYPTNRNGPNVFQAGAVRNIAEDKAGSIWLAAANALSRYDSYTQRFSYFKPDAINGQPEDQLSAVHIDANGTVWAGGGAGLYQFDRQHEKLTYYPSPLQSVNQLIDDGEGNFWVTSRQGFVLFDPQTRTIIHQYIHNPYRSDSSSEERKLSLYRDRAGLVWIGTEGGGVDIYNPRQSLFTFYRHDPLHPETSLSEGRVTSLYATDDDRLWLGIGNVLDEVDLKTNRVTHHPLTTVDPPNNISAVYRDRKGIVWVGVQGFRLYQLNPVNPTAPEFIRYDLKSALSRPTPPKAILDLHEDKDGALWVAVNNEGLYRIDADRQRVQFYEAAAVPPPPPDAKPQSTDSPPPAPPGQAGEPPQGNNRPPPPPGSPGGGPPPRDNGQPPAGDAPRAPITHLVEDQAKGFIWVSTWNGFYRLNPQNGEIVSYRAKPQEIREPDYSMQTIYQDRAGIIWVGSEHGLVRFDPNTQAVKNYSDKDGLSSNLIVGIVEDQAGDLWLSSHKGLSRFTPTTETFHNYDVFDGLQGNEFSSNVAAYTHDGRLFFGGKNGLTVFDPHKIVDNPYLPPVVLTDFQVLSESDKPDKKFALGHQVWATDRVTLESDQNILSFEFAALSYAAPTKNRYRYQLEGFDNRWRETDSTRRFATYTNLAAGNYVFRVQGTNDSGVWSDQAAALALTVAPPWWETTPFRAVMGLLLVVAVLGGYQLRVYTIKRRNRDLETEVARQTQTLQEQTEALLTSGEQLLHAKEAAEAANRAKSAFLANMSHELRSPLNAILGFTQVTYRDRSLSDEVHENLSIILRSGEHLLALINQVLDLSKIEAGHMALNEGNFDLYRLLDDLDDMFVLIADDKHLQLLIERPPDLPRYLRGDAVKLRQVLINLVGNALKFTKQGGVTVRVRHVPDQNAPQTAPLQLQFEVEDTGPGIPADEVSILFEAFAQTASGKQSQEGTGLGLTISRRFIQLMGGDITVKSVVGHGTTFAFDIRCQEVSAAEVPDYGNQRRIVTLKPGQPQYRILVVDDKWANRQLLIRLLKPLGFEMREAENGKEAVDIAQVFQPHLIWMDMRMPIVGGVDATRQIKATAQGQHIIVIALTASAFDEERAGVIAAGCDDFLRKPFRAEEIFDMLSKHLGIQYVYAEDNRETAALSPRAKPQFEDLKSGINALSPELLSRLREAIELGDIEMLNTVVADIRSHQPALAGALARMADRFEYDTLLNLVKDTVK